MADVEKRPDGEEDLQSLIVDLDFVPKWARQDPGVQQVDERRDWGSSGRRPPRDRHQSGGRGRNDRRDRPHGGPRRGHDRRGHDRDHDRGRDHGRGRPFQSEQPRVPVRIDFIPSKDRLSKVVRFIRQSRRAFPLDDVASRFMSHPQFYDIKLTLVDKPERKEDRLQLYQCKFDGMMFLDREACERHALDIGLEKVFEAEESEVEAPRGNFPCVGRCTMGKELVGPPNYHGFNEALENLRRERYPHFAPDRFRERIEMVHDPELVEQWKASQTKTVRYGLAGDAEKTLSRREAEAIFREKHLPSRVVETRRSIVAGEIQVESSDEGLHLAIRRAHYREQKNFMTISLALRPAFKHMGLHLFRAQHHSFITAITPQPLDIEHVVEELREPLFYLTDHPGSNRQQLLEALRPGVEPEAEAAVGLLSSLRWLVEKGHVIEFFDGTLTVPRSFNKS